jgi:YQGE family putative transporter
MALGTYGLINSGISFVAYFFVSRMLKKEYRMKAILFGGVLLFLSMFLIVFDLSYYRLLMYASVIAVAYPLLLVPYMSLTYDVIGRGWKAAEMRIEYIVVKEVFLNMGRVVSILLFLAAITHSFIYFFVRHIKFSSA